MCNGRTSMAHVGDGWAVLILVIRPIGVDSIVKSTLPVTLEALSVRVRVRVRVGWGFS